MEDTFKHKRMRQEMVQFITDKGITDKAVLKAMTEVPRHLFLETMLDYLAYENRPLPINSGQTISQPLTVAYESQLLDAQPEMKVLEVGTGSGYQTAVLCSMGLKVYTIERQKELYDLAKGRFKQMGYYPKCFFGDGYKGLPNYAPFDRVIITCGAPYIPQDLVAQLKVGGVMVIPVGDESQELMRIVKLGEGPGEILQQRYGDCKFVPMLERKEYGER